MTDLTVLISPMPLYPPMKSGFTFGRRSPRPVSRPVMVTLETEIEPDPEEADDDIPLAILSASPRRNRFDSALLSPPPNTWTSRRPRHRPTRSRSAPPERTTFREFQKDVEQRSDFRNHLGIDIVYPDTAPLPQPPSFPPTSFPLTPSTRGGELVRPPPPLLRPTTFWRNNKRSGVAAPSYSPSSHLIRRSTFIAAGLTFDAPVHDLSAFCVESRIGFIVVPPVPEPKLQ